MDKILIDRDELYQYFITENHTEDETANYFNVHDRTIRRRLREFDIQKDWALQKEAKIRRCREEHGVDWYTQSKEAKEKLDVMLHHMKVTCQNKYGVDYVSQLQSVKNKSNATVQRKYGVRTVAHIPGIQSVKCMRYQYDGIGFDSSWELALWIYAKDHNEDIVREPVALDYVYKGLIHKYYPDFLYKGQLIEIKANHAIKNGKLIDIYNNTESSLLAAKTQCMKEHNVVVMQYEDIAFALRYVSKEYGTNYLKSFKKVK